MANIRNPNTVIVKAAVDGIGLCHILQWKIPWYAIVIERWRNVDPWDCTSNVVILVTEYDWMMSG